MLLKLNYLCFQQGISGTPSGMMNTITMAHHTCLLQQEQEDEEAGEAFHIPTTTMAMRVIMITMAMTITTTEEAMKIHTMAMKTSKPKGGEEVVEEPVDLQSLGAVEQQQLEEESVSLSVEAQDPAEVHVGPEEELRREAVWYVVVVGWGDILSSSHFYKC